jgi:hypothetical protein
MSVEVEVAKMLLSYAFRLPAETQALAGSLYYSDRALSTGSEVVGNIQFLAAAISLQVILAILLVLVLQRPFGKAVRFL